MTNNIAANFLKLEKRLETTTQELSQLPAFVEYLELMREIESQKQQLKDYFRENAPVGNHVVALNGDEFSCTVSERSYYSVAEPKKVEDRWCDEVEVENAYMRDGHIYKKEPNTKRVKSYVESGAELPKGFSKKTSKAVSLKLNGKTI